MDMEVYLSIIVPVYNAEKFLQRCLISIQEQTFRDFECLIIDDGSSDGSKTIAEQFARADERFRLIEKPNGGVSSARNQGMQEAKGRYLHFVDADDYLLPEAEQSLYERTQLVSSDALFFQFVYEARDTLKICDRELLPCVQRKELFRSIPHMPYKEKSRNGVLYRLGGFFPSVWRMWIKRTFVIENDKWFDESLKRGEDREFVKDLVSGNGALDYVELYPYVYCYHETSAMRTVKEKDEPHEGRSVMDEWNRLRRSYPEAVKQYEALPGKLFAHACTAYRYNAVNEILSFALNTDEIRGIETLLSQKSFQHWFSWKYIFSQRSGKERLIMIAYKLKLFRLVEQYQKRRKGRS